MNGRENIIQALFLDGEYQNIRRLIYANYLDDKTNGRLNQASKQFKLFGDDYEMWKMRLRKLLPEMDFTNYSPSLKTVMATYRVVLGMQELQAFCLEHMINDFFIKSVDDHDAAINTLFNAVRGGTWRPRSQYELEQMAADLNADKTKFSIIKSLVNGLIQDSLRGITTSPREEPFTIPGVSPVQHAEASEENGEEIAATFAFLGQVRPEDVYAGSQLQIEADPEELNRLTTMIALSKVLSLAPWFLLARNHELVLMGFLVPVYKAYPRLLDFQINFGRGTVRLGEQLFMLALGAQKPAFSVQTVSFGGAPATNIIDWLISIGANSTKRSDRNLYVPDGADDNDEDYPSKLYYHPLYLTLEAMKSVADKVDDSDKAVRYLRCLAHVARNLLDHGAKWDDVFLAWWFQEEKETPRALAVKVLASISEGESSTKKLELKNLLKSLLAHEPKLDATMQHHSSPSV